MSILLVSMETEILYINTPVSFIAINPNRPIAGSLTEARGQKANMHVFKEMLELCQIINTEGYVSKDQPELAFIPFGELFNVSVLASAQQKKPVTNIIINLPAFIDLQSHQRQTGRSVAASPQTQTARLRGRGAVPASRRRCARLSRQAHQGDQGDPQRQGGGRPSEL